MMRSVSSTYSAIRRVSRSAITMTSQGQTCVDTPILDTLRTPGNLRLISGQRSSGISFAGGGHSVVRPPGFPLNGAPMAQSDLRRIRAEILALRWLQPSSEPVRRPVYKTAALPTELHRRITRCMVAHPGRDVLI